MTQVVLVHQLGDRTPGTRLTVTAARAARLVEAGLARPAADERQAPTTRDTKATWVEHAVAHGADRDEAEALTKAALEERYGEAN